MRVTKEQIRLRPLCKICGAAVSSRNCDKSIGFSHPPAIVFPTSQTGQTEEEKLEAVENRLRDKGWNL